MTINGKAADPRAYVSALGFDPYVAWLNVETDERPLNAYQLLGLTACETDMVRVRVSVSKQRAMLDAVREQAPYDIWDAINAEYEEAVCTLYDPERKLVLDTRLRRDAPKKINHISRTAPEVAATMGVIPCRSCHAPNSPTRKFCVKCGTGLYEKCPKCSAEVAANESFCGQCGLNVTAAIGQQESDLEARIQRARQLAREFHFEMAVYELRSVATIEDPRFEVVARRATEMLDKLSQERERVVEKSKEQMEKARLLFEATSYERAYEKLEAIPEPLRPAGFKELMADVRGRRNELLMLSGEIREAVDSNRRHEILPKLERLLTIKPDHEQARKLAVDLRDQVLKAAKKKLLSKSYDEARSLLEVVPSFARTDEVDDLFDKAAELECLMTTIQQAPVADTATLGVVKRLTKMISKDPTSQQQLDKFTQANQTVAADPRMAYRTWSAPPKRFHFDLPVDWLGQPQRLGQVADDLKAKLREHPGQFFVAFGLALQAIEKSSVDFNFDAKGESLLGGLLAFSKTTKKLGWGIDLSDTGLKAICLQPESKSQKWEYVCKHVEFIPHSTPLPLLDTEEERAAVVAETLEQFKSRHDVSKCEVVTGLPGLRVIARFVELPPMNVRKLKAAVEYQVKHEVPLPINEIRWGWHIVRQATGKEADTSPRHIMLAAAKEIHVREQLHRFQSAGIRVDQVTCDALAIHNAYVHEFMPPKADDAKGVSKTAAPKADDSKSGSKGSDSKEIDLGDQDDDWLPRPVAILDVGANITNLIVVRGRKAPWFRSFTPASLDVNERLIRSFQLTHDQAEELKRDPAKAKRLHLLMGTISDTFIKTGSELQRSLGQYQKLYPEDSIERLYGMGGGFQTLGLMRYLIRGA
jgi:Tfp pilus assembly PilM family ATPase